LLSLHDYGARFYDPQIGRFTTQDPISEITRNFTPYHYCINNPITYNDPTGLLAEGFDKNIESSSNNNRPSTIASTHVDEDGNVIAVYNDGDLGVYRHRGRGAAARANVRKNYSITNTSAGGEYMGSTAHWDEFLNEVHGDNGDNFNDIIQDSKIDFDGDWTYTIDEMYQDAFLNMLNILDHGYLKNIIDELPNGKYDLKTKGYKPGVGKKLNGKYATARSAGNYLAGQIGSLYPLTFDRYMQIAGALHAAGKMGVFINTTFGLKFGIAPWFGEVDYCGRMTQAGWLSKKPIK